MTGRDDDEEAAWKDLRQEREGMTDLERIYGEKVKLTKDGFIDGRSERRTGRLFSQLFRMRLDVKAAVRAVKKVHRHPNDAVLFEAMLHAYLEKYPLKESDLPNLKDLIRRLEQERDKDDAHNGKDL